MKQSLQLKLSQHLALTPQLQQSIRLLQLSTLELNQEIELIIQENPLLERPDMADNQPAESAYTMADAPQAERSEEAEPVEIGESASSLDDHWWDEAPSAGPRDPDDDTDWEQPQPESTSLRDYLMRQLVLLPLSDRDRSMVLLLIDALNDDGYLEQDLDELAASLLPEELDVEPIELSTALRHLQNMDPPGVGARTVAECLSLQLRALPECTAHRDCAIQLAENHLALLAARDFARLRKILGCSEDDLRAVHRLIQSLNPRPGAAYAADDTRYVVPDVIVRQHRNKWIASLNGAAVPKIRINSLYADLLQRHRDESSAQLASQLQEARWLIKNIQQRFETILKVSQAIIDRQAMFFEHGEIAMRPLVLREIADEVGLHESTISRVTTQKYMLTPRGIFELKYFFGSHVPTDAGGACSATAIRALIKQLVAQEDPKKPLSDGQIADTLARQGIQVARRTIAKYREGLQIPPANLRKSI